MGLLISERRVLIRFLWCRESGAILLYLVDKYDVEKKYTVTSERDRFKLLQWLFFQASGQGCVLSPLPPSSLNPNPTRLLPPIPLTLTND